MITYKINTFSLKKRCFLYMKYRNAIHHLNRTKFSYKIGCNIRLQPYSISIYWR